MPLRSAVATGLSVLLVACGGTDPAPAPSADHADHADHAAPTKSPVSPAEGTAVKGTVEGAKATHVMDARVRAMPPGSPATGAFFILHNPSGHDAAVVGGSSPAAQSVELHTHVQEDGQFKMRQIDRIDVPAGAQVVLEPGGLHVMLIGLAQPLVEGDTVSLTLDFEGGHSQAFDIPVKAVSAGGHGAHAGHGAHGDHSAHAGHGDPKAKADAGAHAGH